MARRNAPPPAWLGSGRPWRDPSKPRRRLGLRRHAGSAFVALVLASGIGLVVPTDLRLVTTQRSGAAAEVPAQPSAAAVVDSAVPTPLTPVAPSAAAPATASTQSPAADSTSPAAESASPVALVGSGASVSPPEPSATLTGTSATSAPSAAAQPVTTTGGASPISTTSPTTLADLPSNPARRRAQTWEAVPPPSTLDSYVWPLPRGQITDPFGPSPWGSRVVNGQLFHDGIDIATFCGDRIVAAHAGVVLAAGRQFDTKIGWVGDLGPYLARLDAKHLWFSLPITVVIDDGNGYRSIYAHFYQVGVKVGQRVNAGQFLGYEGATGRASGCHLHYGLFAPHETATFALEPSVVERMLVPPFQIARIDPLLVLPRRPGDDQPSRAATSAAGHGLGD